MKPKIKSWISDAYNIIEDLCDVDHLDVEPEEELKHDCAVIIEQAITEAYNQGWYAAAAIYAKRGTNEQLEK